MMSVPHDEPFVAFVTDLRMDGLSSASIASALNVSSWAPPNGKRWHGKQVAELCWASESKPLGAGSEPTSQPGFSVAGHEAAAPWSAPCDRLDCSYHRRLSVLRAIRNWSPFDPEACRIIARSQLNDESAETIAARLNRAGLDAPSGRRWSGALVRAVEHVYSLDGRTQSHAAPIVDGLAA